MEKFREKMKIQNVVLMVCCLLLFLLAVWAYAGEAELLPFPRPAGDAHWQSGWRGFISGASTGVMAVMLFGLIRNIRAMKNEKKMKQLFVSMNDERQKQIAIYTRSSSLQAFLILGMAGGTAAGYFSMTVSITILACTVFCSLLTAVFALYYSKKF